MNARQLNIAAFGGLFATVFVMALCVIGAAGTFNYPAGWVFLAEFTALALAITVYLMKNDPALLERRVRGGPTAEKQAGQKVAMSIASVAFISILVLAGLDRRFGWSPVPLWLVIAGDVVFPAGWWIIFHVFKANPFTSSTIELAQEQRVITTGPYAIVRHPMYAGALVYLLAMPLSLASWWAFAGVALLLPALVWRLFDEERFLADGLPGYAEYRERVKYRLIPGIW